MSKIILIKIIIIFTISYFLFFKKGAEFLSSSSKKDFLSTFGFDQEEEETSTASESLSEDLFNTLEAEIFISNYLKQVQDTRIIEQIIIEESRELDIIQITIQINRELLKNKLSRSYQFIFKEGEEIIFPKDKGSLIKVFYQDIKNIIKQVMIETILSDAELKEIEYLIENQKFIFLNSKESPQEQLNRWNKLRAKAPEENAYHIENQESKDPYKELIGSIGYSLLKSSSEETFSIAMTAEDYKNRFKEIIQLNLFDMRIIFPKEVPKEVQTSQFYKKEIERSKSYFILLANGGDDDESNEEKEIIQPEEEEIKQEISNLMNLNDPQYIYIQLNLNKDKYSKWVISERIRGN